MRLEARKYLRDIQVAAERIERFTKGRQFEQYLADEAFRNILIHGYAAVDDRIVWGVIENYLASLRSAVGELLARP